MGQSPEAVGHEPKLELQLILDAIADGIFGIDAQGKATFCNQARLKMTGYRTEEFIGQDVHELVHHTRLDGKKYNQRCLLHIPRKRTAIHTLPPSALR